MRQQLNDYECSFKEKDHEIKELKIMIKEYEIRLHHAEEQAEMERQDK